MLSIRVGVEVDESGLALAWAREYFGCTSHGQSKEQALQLLPDALREFWNWLRSHGEPDVPGKDTDIQIDHVEVSMVESRLSDGDSEGYFAFDGLPLTAAEFQRAQRYLAYARSDVLALVQSLGDELFFKEVGRSGRSVGATLSHLATTDLWYAQRSGGTPDPLWQIHLLDELRNISLRWLQQSFVEGEVPALSIVAPDAWNLDDRAERWTLPKSLRRYVWHDLVHLRAIRRALQIETRKYSSPEGA